MIQVLHVTTREIYYCSYLLCGQNRLVKIRRKSLECGISIVYDSPNAESFRVFQFLIRQMQNESFPQSSHSKLERQTCNEQRTTHNMNSPSTYLLPTECIVSGEKSTTRQETFSISLDLIPVNDTIHDGGNEGQETKARRQVALRQ